MLSQRFEKGVCLYNNPLASEKDVSGWVKEGELHVSFSELGMELSNKLDPEEHGDHAHWLFWCKEEFPDEVVIEWEFTPLEEPGLCMFFFAANGSEGRDLFAKDLQQRTGYYPQYHSGDIHTLHLSYFRRKWDEERAFHTCNLRKSAGFHLVAMGADPIPNVEDVQESFQIKLIKYKEYVSFSINDLEVLTWKDDGSTGDILTNGRIGFRQMAPMRARYKNLKVYQAILEG